MIRGSRCSLDNMPLTLGRCKRLLPVLVFVGSSNRTQFATDYTPSAACCEPRTACPPSAVHEGKVDACKSAGARCTPH